MIQIYHCSTEHDSPSNIINHPLSLSSSKALEILLVFCSYSIRLSESSSPLPFPPENASSPYPEMTSLSSPSFPSSFQLRLGFKSKKSSYVNLRLNFRRSNCRIRILSAAAMSGKGEGERVLPGESWTNSDAPKDSYSGWFDKDPGDSKRKQWFGGIVGVGLAGIFLASGVLFVSLSLSKRSTGVKQQMEPLTTQQEVLLTSDDHNNANQDGDESNKVLPDEGSLQNDGNSESKTGINQDSVSSVEVTEATSESKPDENVNVGASLTQNIESDYNGVDSIRSASNQDDLQFSPDVNDASFSAGPNPNSPSLPLSDVVECSSDASSFKDTPSIIPSDMSESVIEFKENLDIIEPVDFSVSATDSTNLNADHQEGISIGVEIENPTLPSDLSYSSSVQLPSDPSTVDSLISESDVPLGSQVVSKDVVGTMTSVSSEQDFNPSETVQLPSSEVLSSTPEEHSLNENGPIGSTPASVLKDLYGNEPDTNGQIDIDRSRSLFESPIPENAFSYAGIPAPLLVSAALQVPPGKVLVPAVVDQVQGQALSALQVLKVVEADIKPTDLCTRREYARWLVSASSALSRNTISKVYPAMYIENVTELAFDDVTPEDPDFPCIQGLAEAGLISSKLSRNDMHPSSDRGQDPVLFSPEIPLSRQDLVSWKMALEKRQLPEVDRKIAYQCSGFIDIDKIYPDAWPAIVADLSAGEQSITALAFGFTRLFQPEKPVTKAQAAIALATGDAAEVVGEELARIEAESMAETAVAAHTALVAQVEKDLNASFEKELAMEREKIDAVEKLAEEARVELEKLRTEREEENNSLMRGRAAVESEMEVLSRLRHEVEEQLQSFMGKKMEIEFEKDRINKLRKEAESENQVIVKLQYELEVERKALSMARAWAEDEAKRAREHAKTLEEARERWEQHGIKVVVDGDLREDASAGVTWLNTPKESPVDGTISRAKILVEKLKGMATEIKGKSSAVVEKIIHKIESIVLALKQKTSEAAKQAEELRNAFISKAGASVDEFRQNAIDFSSGVKDGAKRIAGDCREGMEKITQKFKT